MGDAQNIQVVISAVDKTKEAIASATAGLGGFKNNLQALQPAFRTMAVVGTVAFAAVAGVIKTSIDAAKEAEIEMAKFNATMDTMGSAGKKAKDQLIALSRATVKLGFDDEDAANSLAKFFQRTGDVTDAQKLLTVAMDLSRAKSIDLLTATTLVNQVLSGNGRVLKQYGIDIKETASPLEALGILHDRVAGQAEAFANTFGGKMEILSGQMTNMKEAIGSAFIPVLSNLAAKLIPIVNSVTVWIEKNPELTEKILLLSAALTGLVAVVGVLGVSLPIIVKAVQGLAAAFSFVLANPIILFIAAVIAAIAILIVRFEDLKAIIEIFGKGFGIIFGVIIGLAKDLGSVLRAPYDMTMAIVNGIDKIIGAKGFLGGFFKSMGETIGISSPTIAPSTPSASRSVSNFNFDFSGANILDQNKFVDAVMTQINRGVDLKLTGGQ